MTLRCESQTKLMAGGDEDIPAALRDCVIDNIRIGKQIGRGANGIILKVNGKEL